MFVSDPPNRGLLASFIYKFIFSAFLQDTFWDKNIYLFNIYFWKGLLQMQMEPHEPQSLRATRITLVVHLQDAQESPRPFRKPLWKEVRVPLFFRPPDTRPTPPALALHTLSAPSRHLRLTTSPACRIAPRSSATPCPAQYAIRAHVCARLAERRRPSRIVGERLQVALAQRARSNGWRDRRVRRAGRTSGRRLAATGALHWWWRALPGAGVCGRLALVCAM